MPFLKHQNLPVRLVLWLALAELLAPAAFAGAAPPPPVTLRGQLTNLRGGRGTCYLALFASAEGFPRQSNRAVRTLRVPVGAATCAFSFDGLPPGSYALAVFHDENDNGRLDTNFLGIPTERLGFSNDARGMMFFPPSFTAARFAVPGTGAVISVKLR